MCIRDSDAGQVGIGAAATRQVVTVTGRIVSRKLSAIANAPSVTYRVADQTGEVTLLFYGRRDVAGLAPGTTLEITGRIAPLHGQATMSNPQYRILA